MIRRLAEAIKVPGSSPRDWLVRIGTAAVFPLAPGYGVYRSPPGVRLVGWRYAAAAGWTLAAAVFTGWTWRVIGGMGPRDTATHATREDPARPLIDLITLAACVASLGGVVYLLAATPVSGSASWVPVQHGYLAFATTITDALTAIRHFLSFRSV